MTTFHCQHWSTLSVNFDFTTNIPRFYAIFHFRYVFVLGNNIIKSNSSFTAILIVVIELLITI